MKLKISTVKSLKFINVNGVDEEFTVDLHRIKLQQPQRQPNQNITVPTTNPALPIRPRGFAPSSPSSSIRSRSPVDSPPARTESIRDACQYMGRCFRRNPPHKTEFAHPGDPDWHLGECEYGTNCYRQNPIHKSRYTHTRRQAAVRAINNRVDDSNSSEELSDHDADPDFSD